MRSYLCAAVVVWMSQIGGGSLRADDLAAKPVAEDGFVSLFDGKSFAGWHGATENYAAHDGILEALPKKGGNLYTDKEYADFVLRFDYKLSPGANNGIGLRVPDGGRASYEGMEIQVIDDTSEKHAKIKPYQRHGSVYGVIPAKTGHQKPVGEWNEQEIRCIGRRVTIVLNGETILDGDLDEASKDGTLDEKDHPGLARTSGHISLCGHNTQVEFRNLRVKEVPAAP
jgi:hypothetical protein